ncbi:hypothetical protein FACS1894179_02640 [Bacteroidia bacterium]|nr:hypothetical protein FACS1894169_02820 [Bacteroidia bacterium]GHV38756.1 hypothetical protein FACS1894179_02640 [Bacteroidia bacterium]
MKKYLLITLSILSFTGIWAQESRGTVSKRVVEKNKKADSKTTYNYMLLDAVNDADAFYTEYESTVQMVWDGKLNAISIKNEKGKAMRGIQNCLDVVTGTPVYQGGDEYQLAVIRYIIAVKEKIESLETLGVLGADKDSNAETYNRASVKFTDISNEAIGLRNAVRDKKDIYEKTFYVNSKKKK